MPAEEEAVLDYKQIWLSPRAAGMRTFCLHKMSVSGNLIVLQEVWKDANREEGTDYRQPAGDIL